MIARKKFQCVWSEHSSVTRSYIQYIYFLFGQLMTQKRKKIENLILIILALCYYSLREVWIGLMIISLFTLELYLNYIQSKIQYRNTLLC